MSSTKPCCMHTEARPPRGLTWHDAEEARPIGACEIEHDVHVSETSTFLHETIRNKSVGVTAAMPGQVKSSRAVGPSGLVVALVVLVAVSAVSLLSLVGAWRRMEASLPSGSEPPATPGVSQLHQALQEVRPFVLRPRAFFVSWSGVVTLAFRGWPPQIASLKVRLDERLGSTLRPENPGSRWPKITLGALQQGRQPLSMEELKLLTALCVELTAALEQEHWELQVDSLAQTVFAWPSHELLVSRFDLPLQGGAVDTAEPSEEAAGYVEKVLMEGDDLEAYLPQVQKPGDITKYRSGSPGVSLVAFVLSSGAGAALPPSLVELQQRIDKALPNAYGWMKPDSLHCTLRALV